MTEAGLQMLHDMFRDTGDTTGFLRGYENKHVMTEKVCWGC